MMTTPVLGTSKCYGEDESSSPVKMKMPELLVPESKQQWGQAVFLQEHVSRHTHM